MSIKLESACHFAWLFIYAHISQLLTGNLSIIIIIIYLFYIIIITHFLNIFHRKKKASSSHSKVNPVRTQSLEFWSACI